MEIKPVNDYSECRPEVLRFAMLMEEELRRNDWKGGWQFMTKQQIMGRIHQEVQELNDEVKYPRESARMLVKETLDVANFCMFMADIHGALK